MADLSAEFRTRLEEIFGNLSAALDLPPFQLKLAADSHVVRFHEGVLYIPVRYEVHWRQLRTVPTELVWDAAYDVRQRTGDGIDEALCSVFAETFVRDHVLNAE